MRTRNLTYISSPPGVSLKKVFWKYQTNLQENFTRTPPSGGCFWIYYISMVMFWSYHSFYVLWSLTISQKKSFNDILIYWTNSNLKQMPKEILQWIRTKNIPTQTNPTNYSSCQKPIHTELVTFQNKELNGRRQSCLKC